MSIAEQIQESESEEQALAVAEIELGWSLDTQLQMALRYIENQQDHAAFVEFVANQADFELDAGDPESAD